VLDVFGSISAFFAISYCRSIASYGPRSYVEKCQKETKYTQNKISLVSGKNAIKLHMQLKNKATMVVSHEEAYL